MALFRILLLLALAVAATSAALVYSGAYDVSATDQHLPPTYWLLDLGMTRSVKRRAAQIEVPDLSNDRLAQRGAALYNRHCVQCHGAPGVAPEAFALGLTPVPASLVDSSRKKSAAEQYWIVRNGLKMTAMPAWEFRLSDEDLWSVVAFLRHLPTLSTSGYHSFTQAAGEAQRITEAERAMPADAERGRRAIQQYACATCHHIPGITGARAAVGPPLEGIGRRQMLAGVMPNTAENMVGWLRRPQATKPQTAMPDLGLSERDARDIAAYLFTLQ